MRPGELQGSSGVRSDTDVVLLLSHSGVVVVPRGLCDHLLRPLRHRGGQGHRTRAHQPTRPCNCAANNPPSVHLPPEQRRVIVGLLFQVSLRWSSDKAQPGERVSLTVTVLEPKSHVGIMVTGTHGDAPQADLDFRGEQV